MATPKSNILLASIDSREDALHMVRGASTLFFAVAGLIVVVSYWLGFGMLLDAAVYATGGFFLRRFYSRTAAVVLLCLAALGAGVSFANQAGADLGGGHNIFLALIVLAAAIRAVEATFKLRERFPAPPAVPSAPAAAPGPPTNGKLGKLGTLGR